MKTLPLAVVVAFFGVTVTHAQVVTPQPAPTIITIQPYTISKAGYYQLGADLSSSATVGTSSPSPPTT